MVRLMTLESDTVKVEDRVVVLNHMRSFEMRCRTVQDEAAQKIDGCRKLKDSEEFRCASQLSTLSSDLSYSLQPPWDTTIPFDDTVAIAGTCWLRFSKLLTR